MDLADGDLRTAVVILGDENAEPRVACFLAQQAAEKALKAGLLSCDQPAPKVHALTRLHAGIPAGNRPEIDPDQLDELEAWVIDGRYPDDLPGVGRDRARELVEMGRRVVEACRPLVEPSEPDHQA